MMVKSGFITISYCKNPSSISHKLYNFSHKQTYNIKHFPQRRLYLLQRFVLVRSCSSQAVTEVHTGKLRKVEALTVKSYTFYIGFN